MPERLEAPFESEDVTPSSANRRLRPQVWNQPLRCCLSGSHCWESSRVWSLCSLPPAAVQIGRLTFKRFDRGMPWLAACCAAAAITRTWLTCRHTVTDEAGKEALTSVTSKTEAWIGLHFSAASRPLSWSSNLGASILTWLQVPKFGAGLCAGLCTGLHTYACYAPRVYSMVCSSLQPFICFCGAWQPCLLALGLASPERDGNGFAWQWETLRTDPRKRFSRDSG